MATVKTSTVLIKTDDSQGSGSVIYNTDSKLQQAPIKLTWNGGSVAFSTVLEYQTFISQVVIPLTNTLNSPSGAGSGYVAITPGVAGSDKVVN